MLKKIQVNRWGLLGLFLEFPKELKTVVEMPVPCGNGQDEKLIATKCKEIN
ncbi:hypothetical protein SLEP1_g49183 [Rubroshorea leprosula]|uniref:Uncharacterized protein n=1 Tax=Rubroshorea leprosula TaxID=152421 RepID=A0AAV5LX98_9ROSI|nr:hypothetical protein SLEP1_g49183 [Rubroshorea leprosula]